MRAQAPAWPLTAPKRARHAAVTAEMHHEATVSTRRRDRPQPRASGRSSGAVLLPAQASQAQARPACDEARELQLAAEVAQLETKYAASVQVRGLPQRATAGQGSPLHDINSRARPAPWPCRCARSGLPERVAARAQVNKDLGAEQWEALKRAREMQRALDAAAVETELAFLKGRLEGLAAVVAGAVEERAAAAQMRTRAEAAEASAADLQARSALALPIERRRAAPSRPPALLPAVALFAPARPSEPYPARPAARRCGRRRWGEKGARPRRSAARYARWSPAWRSA